MNKILNIIYKKIIGIIRYIYYKKDYERIISVYEKCKLDDTF